MDEKKIIQDKYVGTFVFTLLILLILALVSWYFYNFQCNSEDGFGWCPQSTKEEWGQFGDFFGGILNPVLSFFVFYFAFKTYMAQMKQFAANKKSADIQNFTSSTMITVSKIESILSEKNSISIYNETYSKTLKTLYYAFAGMCETLRNGKFCPKHYVDFEDTCKEFAEVEQQVSFQLALLNEVGAIWNVEKETLATQICLALGGHESIYGLWIFYKNCLFLNRNFNPNIVRSTSMMVDMLESTIMHFEVINFTEVVSDVRNAEEIFSKYRQHFYPNSV